MIAAVGRNYEIGIGNEIPWRCPTDLKLFKKLTKNATVVMGRKTMESLKRPLPERHNLVLTRSNGYIPNGFYPAGVDDVLRLPDPVWVIGGGEIYSLLMPHVEEIWLSHIGIDAPGADAFFPASIMRFLGFIPVETAYTQRANESEPGFLQIVYRRT
ncbi:dihydrofolate reductase [Salmonella enterica subsp. enterica serovar Anatum]|uniref:trimethoprim-resistant dihydrofolate reductase DfrA51 n=1 Tax=Salmonella enterica TaxID=28901 RepID=UPI0019A10053|nr:dihydrofolate reductase [Salmonella enterica]EGC9580499.1 dihydrofolate reductase [Salmonella enterica subsp. enterica serovar Anatum]EGN8597493.1 dihydrofolate reductase [Salmonella enterica subsp. enterica serovar Eko]EHD3174059.1 dihydrofolate reductase [Salmonella enterica]EHH2973104.1 dihydrofolate reductase [Salmonella enterica]